MQRLQEVLNYDLINIGAHQITLMHIFSVILIVSISKFLVWGLKKGLTRKLDDPTEMGRRMSAFTIGQYIIWVLTIVLSLEALTFDITILIAGSAALLVGIGLGLQDLFRDFISGVIMLFDGTIRVGDVLEVDGIVGEVKEIKLRTSVVSNLDGIILIVPNSSFVTKPVINWTHDQRRTRFEVTVGVAYGSDVHKVREVLIACAKEHSQVLKTPEPFVQFTDFGDSQLSFRLLFFSQSVFAIQNVKSDIRFSITDAFTKNNITIPFPQRDVHVRHYSTIEGVQLGNDPVE